VATSPGKHRLPAACRADRCECVPTNRGRNVGSRTTRSPRCYPRSARPCARRAGNSSTRSLRAVWPCHGRSNDHAAVGRHRLRASRTHRVKRQGNLHDRVKNHAGVDIADGEASSRHRSFRNVSAARGLSPSTMAVDPTGDSNDTTTPDHLPQHGGLSLSLSNVMCTHARHGSRPSTMQCGMPSADSVSASTSIKGTTCPYSHRTRRTR